VVLFMLRMAYFISAYKKPESIIRLVNVLANEEDLFYIHFDKKVKSQTFKKWRTLIIENCQTENIQILSKFQTKWGAFGVSDATISAMRHFDDFDYDYFTNLTGECYPLKSSRQIKETFKNQNSGFMNFWKIPYEGWAPARGGFWRIHNRFYFLPKKKYPYVRKIRIPRLNKKMPNDLEPYGGWSLFSLPKDMISYALKYLDNNPNVKAFYKRTFAPNEMMWQTILMNSPFKDRIVNDNMRYIEFIRSHPRILTKKDYSTLKNSGRLFARKFDSDVDREILDIIDREMIGIKAPIN
jgi:hypothetical protein